MRKLSFFAAIVVIVSHAGAWARDDIIVKRDAAERFVVLPDGVRFPEGLTANPKTEEIYVGTFDGGPNANKLLRFKKNGELVAEKSFGGTPLLGLQFNRCGTTRSTFVTSALRKFSGSRPNLTI
jgi:hypothetical protein